jgi:hypothetical protein
MASFKRMHLLTGGLKTYIDGCNRRSGKEHQIFTSPAPCMYQLIEAAGGGGVKGGSVTAYV